MRKSGLNLNGTIAQTIQIGAEGQARDFVIYDQNIYVIRSRNLSIINKHNFSILDYNLGTHRANSLLIENSQGYIPGITSPTVAAFVKFFIKSPEVIQEALERFTPMKYQQ